MAGTRFVKTGGGFKCYPGKVCCTKDDYKNKSKPYCYVPQKSEDFVDNLFYKMKTSKLQFINNIEDLFNNKYKHTMWIDKKRRRRSKLKFFNKIVPKMDASNRYTSGPIFQKIQKIIYRGTIVNDKKDIFSR